MSNPRNRYQALTWLEAQVDLHNYDWTFECDHAQAVAAGYAHSGDPTATDNWNSIGSAHKRPLNTVQQGDVLFYPTDKAGHVVTNAEGGHVYTTDFVRGGRIDYAPFSLINDGMGMIPPGTVDPAYAFPQGGGRSIMAPIAVVEWPNVSWHSLTLSRAHKTPDVGVGLLQVALDKYLGGNLAAQPDIFGPKTVAAFEKASRLSNRTELRLARFLGTIGHYVLVP